MVVNVNETTTERQTARKKPRGRLLCWLHERDSHGRTYTHPCFMPEGEKPDNGDWIRAPWMDEPDAKAE